MEIEDLQGTTFLHFERDEDEWRLIFEIVIKAIVALKSRPFCIRSFVSTIYGMYDDMSAARTLVNNLNLHI